MKKAVPCLLCAALLVPLMPVAGWAQEEGGGGAFSDLLQNRPYDRAEVARELGRVLEEAAVRATVAAPEAEGAPGFLPLAPAAEEVRRLPGVALVLPLNGAGAAAVAAERFRQGCVDALAAGRPVRVEIYAHDGGRAQALAAYEGAVADGARLVIGPMLKGNVRAVLEAYPAAPARTLLPQPEVTAANSGYYVLTIDAGEEAAELARLIAEEGRRVMVVSDGGAVSRRQSAAFVTAWVRARGAPLEFFSVGGAGGEEEWRALFDNLKARRETKRDEEGNPIVPTPAEIAARARERPLAVFAAGGGAFARRVRNFVPHGYPLYASSVFFVRDDDARFLANLRLMEMPWFLGEADAGGGGGFESSVARTYPVLQQRFYVLGADSCRAARRAGEWYDGWAMQGASGALRLAGANFRRRGVVAHFRDGRLVPLEASVSSAEEGGG